MDKKAWIVIVLCLASLGVWQWAYMKYYPPRPPAPAPAPAEQAAVPAPMPAPVATAPVAAVELPDATPGLEPRTETLSTPLADFIFINDLGGLARVVLLDHLGENGAKVVLNRPEAMAIGAIGEEAGRAYGGFEFEPTADATEVRFVRDFGDGLRAVKTWRVSPGGGDGNYTVTLDLTFTNTGGADVHRLGYFVSTGAAAPEHYGDLPYYTGFDWLRGKKATFIDVNWFNASSVPLVGIQLRPAQSLYLQQDDDITWAAVKSQYFTTIVAATGETRGTSVWARRFDLYHGGDAARHVYGIEGGLGMPGFKLAPGESLTQSFQIYAGPKELGRLTRLGQRQGEVMNFGMFKWVSEILLFSMNALHRWLGNYAAAIIVLTIIIKALLWPLQNKATNSMRRMALLSPKMTELREKYKDDPTKMNQELMKLYKDYGVNPFSGCVPMLIQIPIFFGFYSMLGTAIELRNSSFLWVQDLSQPDTVFHIAGFPINVLPLLMAATMFWQMHITPKTGDAVQQRVFMFMPLIFVVFAYNFASALSLYWTTQNLISILQLYLTRNKPLPVLEKKSVAAKKALEAGKQKKRRSPR